MCRPWYLTPSCCSGAAAGAGGMAGSRLQVPRLDIHTQQLYLCPERQQLLDIAGALTTGKQHLSLVRLRSSHAVKCVVCFSLMFVQFLHVDFLTQVDLLQSAKGAALHAVPASSANMRVWCGVRVV